MTRSSLIVIVSQRYNKLSWLFIEAFLLRSGSIPLFSEAELLVIDDLFLRKKIRPDGTDDFQEIVMNRYGARKSTLITSNRILDDWGICLGDNAVATAIIDRLLHHCNLLKFEGKSYRLKEAASVLAKNSKER